MIEESYDAHDVKRENCLRDVVPLFWSDGGGEASSYQWYHCRHRRHHRHPCFATLSKCFLHESHLWDIVLYAYTYYEYMCPGPGFLRLIASLKNRQDTSRGTFGLWSHVLILQTPPLYESLWSKYTPSPSSTQHPIRKTMINPWRVLSYLLSWFTMCISASSFRFWKRQNVKFCMARFIIQIREVAFSTSSTYKEISLSVF